MYIKNNLLVYSLLQLHNVNKNKDTKDK